MSKERPGFVRKIGRGFGLGIGRQAEAAFGKRPSPDATAAYGVTQFAVLPLYMQYVFASSERFNSQPEKRSGAKEAVALAGLTLLDLATDAAVVATLFLYPPAAAGIKALHNGTSAFIGERVARAVTKKERRRVAV